MRNTKRSYDTTIDDGKSRILTDWAFLGLLLFTAAIRIFQALNTYVIELDSYTIIETAKTFGNLSSLSPMDLAVRTHPLFPLLMALFSRCGIEYETAGQALSIFFGTITVVPVYLATRAAYGRRVGLISMFLFSVHPYLVVNASNVLRDSTSTFLLVSTFYAAWKGLEETKDRYLVLSGIFAALAYLTKAEGLFAIVIVLAYIWTRGLFKKEMTIGRRIRATFSFSTIPLAATVFLVAIFSLKSGSFTLSFSKPLAGLANAVALADVVNATENNLSVLGGFSSGFLFFDRASALMFILFEAVTAVYAALMAINLMRFKEKRFLMPIEHYYLFVVAGLLTLDFAYFSILHLFSRRYLLAVVILLMGFAGFGMNRIIEWLEKADERIRKNGRAIPFKTGVILLIVIAFIVGSVMQTKRYWEYRKSSLKSAGLYIHSRSGDAAKILSDDPRVAYYANGVNTPLSEKALKRIAAKPAGKCPYNYIIFYYSENLSMYYRYRTSLAHTGFREISIPLADGVHKIIILGCTKNR